MDQDIRGLLSSASREPGVKSKENPIQPHTAKKAGMGFPPVPNALPPYRRGNAMYYDPNYDPHSGSYYYGRYDLDMIKQVRTMYL